MLEIVQQFKAHYEGEMKRVATDLGNLSKLKPQKLPDVSAMSHKMADITLEGCIESLEPLVQEITYTVAEEKSLIEDWKKNIVKLKGEDKTELELWMVTLRTDSNVETAISAVKSLRRDYALSITEAKTME